MKTSGIHFCYKRQSDHSHEQVKIHINTSRKTSTVQIVKNHRMRHFLSIRDILLAVILMSCGVKFLNSKWSILKTADANELKTPGGYSPKFRIGVCRERSQTLTLSKDKENEN